MLPLSAAEFRAFFRAFARHDFGLLVLTDLCGYGIHLARLS
jgi:hypothetical protein